jgi:Tol biopolymer transport system component
VHRTDRAPSSPAFDWLMGVLVFLVMVGVYQDGWAHTHGKVDESFFTPWHAMLYGGVAITGLTLLCAGIVGLRKGYTLRQALPHGYWLGACGVVLFLIGGGLDEIWHTLFGIEVDLQALVSPTHLLLVFAGGMMIGGPLRSIASQYGRQSEGWRTVGPAVFAVLSLLMMLGFFTQYVLPLGDGSIVANLSHNFGARVSSSIYRFSLANGQSQRVTTGVDAYGASASPDGKRIVYRVNRPDSKASDIVVADADGSRALRITASGYRDTQPAWSPDGKWIAYISSPAGTSGNFRLVIMRPDGRNARVLVDGTTRISFPSWSPSSTSIAYSSRNGMTPEIALVDIATGKSMWLSNTVGGSRPALGAPAIGLAYVREGTIFVGPGNGNPVSFHAEILQATDPAFSPDGKSLTYIRNDGDSDQVIRDNDIVGPGRTILNISNLSGMNAAHPTWSHGFIYATIAGREPPYVGYIADARSEAGFLIQSVLLAGMLLLLVRRWRAPVGSITLIVTLASLALLFQSDEQPLLWCALVTGLIGDVLLILLRERARSGIGSYVFGAVVPGVLSALYLAALYFSGPLGWHPDLIFGTPVMSAAVGLIVAFCYEPPLPEGSPSSR